MNIMDKLGRYIIISWLSVNLGYDAYVDHKWMEEPSSVYVTYYDALCEEESGCNVEMQSNGDGYFASMIPVTPEWYGIMAACDPALFGLWIDVQFPNQVVSLYCGDSFGNGVDTIRDNSYRIDIFYPYNETGEYPCNTCTLPIIRRYTK